MAITQSKDKPTNQPSHIPNIKHQTLASYLDGGDGTVVVGESLLHPGDGAALVGAAPGLLESTLALTHRPQPTQPEVEVL